jgi:hypothetical protein
MLRCRAYQVKMGFLDLLGKLFDVGPPFDEKWICDACKGDITIGHPFDRPCPFVPSKCVECGEPAPQDQFVCGDACREAFRKKMGLGPKRRKR